MTDDLSKLSQEELHKMLKEVKEILSLANESVERNRAFIEKIDEEAIPLNERLMKLREDRHNAVIAGKDAENQLNSNKGKIEDILHALRRAELARLEAEEFVKFKEQILLETAGASWREFAYDHQIDGAARLALVHRGILGDQRGLGKTLCSLIFADMRKARKIIVIAPNETIKNFEEEGRHWAKHRTIISLIGKDRGQRDFTLSMLKEQDQWILFVNLEAWRRDKTFIPALSNTLPDTVIIDEAHYLKEDTSTAFKGVRDLVYTPNLCLACGGTDFAKSGLNYVCLNGKCRECYSDTDDSCCSVKNVIPMSGTTILNRPPELFPLLYLVDRKSFPNKKQFLTRYCVNYGANDWRFRYGGEEALVKKIGPQYVRRNRKDAGIVIPPQTIQFHNLELDPEKYPLQWRAYEELKERWFIWSESGEGVPINDAIVQILRLRQLITWPMGIRFHDPKTKALVFQCDVNQSVKVDYATNLAKELIVEEGERAVLFSQFKAPIQEIRSRLSDIYNPATGRNISVAVYDGGTPESIRTEIRHDFDAKMMTAGTPPKWDICLANYKVAGQSINLTGATQTILLDREWNPGKEDQALGRTDRIGQTRETTVHILSVLKTIDTWLDSLIERKAQIINGFDVQINMAEEFMRSLKSGEI